MTKKQKSSKQYTNLNQAGLTMYPDNIYVYLGNDYGVQSREDMRQITYILIDRLYINLFTKAIHKFLKNEEPFV